MASLVSTVKSKILETIRDIDSYKAGTRAVRDPRTGREIQEDVIKRIWKAAVLDQQTRKLLKCVMTDDEIIGECVTEITTITADRGQSSLPALYFVMPTTENARRIAEDARQDRYTAVYVIFADAADDNVLNILIQSRELSRMAEENGENGQSKLSIFDLPLDFFPLEAQAFSLKSPELFFDMYSPPRNEQAAESSRKLLHRDLQLASKRIAGVCIAMNEYPLIRYYMPPNHQPLGPLNPASTSRPEVVEPVSRFRTTLARNNHDPRAAAESISTDHATKTLAEMVQLELDNYKKLQKGVFPVPKRDRNNNPIPTQQGTLIITDRSMDTIAPFIHEFTYQAMVHDLLRIKDNVYTYDFVSGTGDHETVDATLGDHDKLWTELRHTHVVEAIATFKARLPKEATSSGNNLDDVRDALANLSIEKENREQLSLHTNMATECMRIFKPTENDQILESVASIEQDCATGQTSEGKTPKTLIEDMVPLLDMREVKNSDKARIIALYIQYRQGISEEDRRRLYLHARLTQQEQDAVTNLLYLGVRINRDKHDKDIKGLRPKKHVEDEYVLSRYKPMLKTVLEDHVGNKLDYTTFPYVRNAPALLAPALNRAGSSQSQSSQMSATSLRHTRAEWTQKKKAEDGTRGRIIVFVAGGMSYSEMREAYLLSRSLDKDIYIGSTHAITPVGFIGDLSMLGFGGPPSKSGVENKRTGSFQEYYDDTYFVKDEPRRPPPSAAPQMPPRVNPGGNKLTKGPPAPDMYAPLSGYRGLEEEKKKGGKLSRFLGVKK